MSTNTDKNSIKVILGALPIKELVLLLTSCFVFLLGTEIVFRMFQPKLSNSIKSDRPIKYYFPEKSGSARDFFYEKQKPSDIFRIVVVGDSFAFGFNNFFDDAFPKRLERLLNLNQEQTKVEVLNFGTPGFSTRKELPSVKWAVEDFHADLVILQITLNDPEISSPRLHRGSEEKLFQEGIYKYFRSLAYVKKLIENTRSFSSYTDYFSNLYRDPKTLSNFTNSVAAAATTCKKAGVPMYSVVFPLFAMPLDDKYPFFEAHNIIHDTLKKNDISYLDLFDTYKGMSTNRLEADPGKDPHPSELAHRIASEAILIDLAAKKLVPENSIPKLSSEHREMRGRLHGFNKLHKSN